MLARRASRRKTAGWFSVTQRTKVPICHSRVAIGVHTVGVGFISTYTPPTSKPKLSDWSLWERGDILGGIVLETTSLCLRTQEALSSASCRRPTCRAIRAEADTPRPTAGNAGNRAARRRAEAAVQLRRSNRPRVLSGVMEHPGAFLNKHLVISDRNSRGWETPCGRSGIPSLLWPKLYLLYYVYHTRVSLHGQMTQSIVCQPQGR